MNEKMLEEGTKVRSLEDGQIYTIHDATPTNNQFGYGVYRYRVKERLDTGFALHKKWFEVLCGDCEVKTTVHDHGLCHGCYETWENEGVLE